MGIWQGRASLILLWQLVQCMAAQALLPWLFGPLLFLTTYMAPRLMLLLVLRACGVTAVPEQLQGLGRTAAGSSTDLVAMLADGAAQAQPRVQQQQFTAMSAAFATPAANSSRHGTRL